LILKARSVSQALLENDPDLDQSPYLAAEVRAMEAEAEAAFIEKG
jgi:hypothetical protein